MLVASHSSSLASLQAQEARLLRRALWLALLLHAVALGLFFLSQFWDDEQSPAESEPERPLLIPLALELAEPPANLLEVEQAPTQTPAPQTRDAGQESASSVESFMQSSRNSRAGTNRADLAADFERLALNGSQQQQANALESERLLGQDQTGMETAIRPTATPEPSAPSSAVADLQLPESDLLQQRAIQENSEPELQAAAEQIQRRAQTMTGQLRSDGTSQFDTEATALGAYMEQVGEAVAQSWQEAVSERRGNPGALRLRFRIRPSGESTNFEFVGLREAGSVAEDITLEAVIQATLPPIPEEVLKELPQGWMECEYEFLFL